MKEWAEIIQSIFNIVMPIITIFTLMSQIKSNEQNLRIQEKTNKEVLKKQQEFNSKLVNRELFKKAYDTLIMSLEKDSLLMASNVLYKVVKEEINEYLNMSLRMILMKSVLVMDKLEKDKEKDIFLKQLAPIIGDILKLNENKDNTLKVKLNLSHLTFPYYKNKEGNIIGLNFYQIFLDDLKQKNTKDDPIEGFNLIDIKLQGSILRGINLSHSNLKGADLQNADLKGAHLEYSNLENANLQKAYLKGVFFVKANLKGTYLQNASLSKACLWDISLQNSSLQLTKFKNADLEGANLQGSFLLNNNFENTCLNNVIIDYKYFDMIENKNVRFFNDIIWHEKDRYFLIKDSQKLEYIFEDK